MPWNVISLEPFIATEVRLGEEALTWLSLQSEGVTALLQVDLMPLMTS